VFVTCRLASIDHVEVGGDQVDLYRRTVTSHSPGFLDDCQPGWKGRSTDDSTSVLITP